MEREGGEEREGLGRRKREKRRGAGRVRLEA